MSLFGLGKNIGGVVLSQEEMIDSRGNLNSEPFCEFLVLYAEILDGIFNLDLLEKFGQAVSFDHVSAESVRNVSNW